MGVEKTRGSRIMADGRGWGWFLSRLGDVVPPFCENRVYIYMIYFFAGKMYHLG